MKANYLICYDITSPRRLSRVYKFLKGRGLHLQYSVFLCSLTYQELKDVKERLKELIDEKLDDIRIYPLPSSLKVAVIGKGARIPEGVDIHMGQSSTWEV